MKKSNNIAYTFSDGLYLNITNACPCECTFCVRNNGSGVGSADNLWLSDEPGADEIMGAIFEYDLHSFREIVFCGYGEPTCALQNLLEVCRRLKKLNVPPIRLNTNGLGSLINNTDVPPLLKGLIDSVSISLNAPTKEEYLAVTRPAFGEESFSAMLNFARDCKGYVKTVAMTVVDVIGEDNINAGRRLAEGLGITFRVRTLIR